MLPLDDGQWVIHFTANPIFEDGVKDPVKRRSGLVQKTSDEVDLVIDDAVLEAAGNSQKPTRQQVMQDASKTTPWRFI